jgi:hypothetical protein
MVSDREKPMNATKFTVVMVDAHRANPKIEEHMTILTFPAENYVSGGDSGWAVELPDGSFAGAWPLQGKQLNLLSPAQTPGLRKRNLDKIRKVGDGLIDPRCLSPTPAEVPVAARMRLLDGYLAVDPKLVKVQQAVGAVATEVEFSTATDDPAMELEAVPFGSRKGERLTLGKARTVRIAIANLSVASLDPRAMGHEAAYLALLQNPPPSRARSATSGSGQNDRNLFGLGGGCNPGLFFEPPLATRQGARPASGLRE